jgi:hypothetical protein
VNGTGSNGTASNGTAANGTVSNGTSSNGNGAAANGNGAANGVGSGRRAKRAEGGDTPPAERASEQVAVSAEGQEGAGREPGRAESTEGLGIADLLAGALAAYRGI